MVKRSIYFEEVFPNKEIIKTQQELFTLIEQKSQEKTSLCHFMSRSVNSKNLMKLPGYGNIRRKTFFILNQSNRYFLRYDVPLIGGAFMAFEEPGLNLNAPAHFSPD